MIIRNAKFVVSLDRLTSFPGQGLPEIAMAGKSNVGKSSLIKSLTRNSRLARTSAEPGKTRLINFYAVNGEMLLVDLPGYGFAKASKQEKQKWGNMIEGYLENSRNLRHVLQLVDVRHEPTSDDQMMVEYLRHYEIPFTVVATKADKLSRAQTGRSVQAICRALQVQPWEVMPVSAQSRQGLDALLERLDGVVGAGEAEP